MTTADLGDFGGAIFVAGWFVLALAFVCFRHRAFFVLLVLGPLMILAGAWLIGWWAALLLVAFAVGLALAMKIVVFRDDAYQRNYPVFASAPFRTILAKDGFEYRLHIAPVKSGYGIGLDFDVEPESGVSNIRTRWRDTFPDRAAAERELMRRLREYIGSDHEIEGSGGDHG